MPSRTADQVVNALQAYAVTLSTSRRRTFERYRPTDLAFKLVGTGSVGTRDYVVLLFGNDVTDPLFMQVKLSQNRSTTCTADLLGTCLLRSSVPTRQWPVSCFQFTRGRVCRESVPCRRQRARS